MKIYAEAMNAPGPVSMKGWFQHYCKYVSLCLICCFTSQSTAMVMSGNCLHFMGLLLNIEMS